MHLCFGISVKQNTCRASVWGCSCMYACFYMHTSWSNICVLDVIVVLDSMAERTCTGLFGWKLFPFHLEHFVEAGLNQAHQHGSWVMYMFGWIASVFPWWCTTNNDEHHAHEWHTYYENVFILIKFKVLLIQLEQLLIRLFNYRLE